MTDHKNIKYYKKEEGKDRIICLLCQHYCKLKEGQTGICGVNKNVDGALKNLVYGHPVPRLSPLVRWDVISSVLSVKIGIFPKNIK